MRYFLGLILWLMPLACFAQSWEDQRIFGRAAASQSLRILSSTDTSFFAPIITGFLQTHPNWTVEYLVTGTADIDRIFRAAPADFDLVISSAMDLQLKLVNDGYALPLPDLTHPAWAQWRHSLFAFTSEPATIVVNRDAFPDMPIPQSRQELIQALRAHPDRFRGKLGTYDVRQSGLGYLFATQDARASETYWRLMEVMGSLGANLYCCSGEMIDDVASGDIFVAYNVLGSYASARQQQDNSFEIILPSDFPTTMMRTGFVSDKTRYPGTAAAFIQHMIEVQTADRDPGGLSLPPLSAIAEGANRSVISLEPALMTYLDRLKRKTFIKEWMNAVIQ